jgi:hypothetical protein
MNFLEKKNMIIRNTNGDLEGISKYNFKTTHDFYNAVWEKQYNISIPKDYNTVKQIASII